MTQQKSNYEGFYNHIICFEQNIINFCSKITILTTGRTKLVKVAFFDRLFPYYTDFTDLYILTHKLVI